jgi:hypothetical protein
VNSEEGFSKHFQKFVSNFKESNKKLTIARGSEKLLKDLENHQRIHRKYRLKCLDLQQIYTSRDTVPLKTQKALKTYLYVVKRPDTFILADFLSRPYTAFNRGEHGNKGFCS